MDSPTNSNKCDPSSLSENVSILPIDKHQNHETSQLKDAIPTNPSAGDNEDNRCEKIGKDAAVIEQQVLVKPCQIDAELCINENTNKESPNISELSDVHGNDLTAEKIEQGTNVSDKISEESSKMIIDEQHLETRVSDCQITNDNLMHAVLLNRSEDTSSIDASFSITSDVVLNPAPTSVNTEKEQDLNQPSSLALLAQYDTEDDSDDDVREVTVAQSYQNRCVEIDSDSSTSDVEFLTEIRSSINLDRLDVDNEGEDDDDEEEGNIRTKRQPKVKGELHLEDLPPIEDLHINVPEEECTELGKIHSIVEQLVLVNALPGTVPLDLETVLFRDKGNHVLGEVFDVLGQVSDPLYCVRFNSNKEIKEKGIEVGQTVYVAPRTKHTQFVVLANLMKVRGSDASWENDVEPPPRFIDYSDDEEERSARRPNRKRQSSTGVTYAGRGSYTPRRPYRGNYSGRGEIRPPHKPQENYNMVGNSWHSNFY